MQIRKSELKFLLYAYQKIQEDPKIKAQFKKELKPFTKFCEKFLEAQEELFYKLTGEKKNGIL